MGQQFLTACCISSSLSLSHVLDLVHVNQMLNRSLSLPNIFGKYFFGKYFTDYLYFFLLFSNPPRFSCLQTIKSQHHLLPLLSIILGLQASWSPPQSSLRQQRSQARGCISLPFTSSPLGLERQLLLVATEACTNKSNHSRRLRHSRHSKAVNCQIGCIWAFSRFKTAYLSECKAVEFE